MDILPLEAVEASENDQDEALIARMATEIVRRRLTTPAILFLESVKPLNFIGSQFLVFLDPIVRLFLTVPEYQRFARLLEDRATIERLIVAIEGAADA